MEKCQILFTLIVLVFNLSFRHKFLRFILFLREVGTFEIHEIVSRSMSKKSEGLVRI